MAYLYNKKHTYIMKPEKIYIKLAKQELGQGATKYNNVELAIFGHDIHKRRQSEIDQIFNIKKL